MSIETEYNPKYVGMEDVPLSGPDNYTPEQKAKALFNAESSLELDVNGGEEIQSDNLISAHKAAVINLATHVLTHGAEDPSDVTLGDMQSGGGEIADYSSRYLEEYERLVDKINESGAGSSSYGNYALVVNNKNQNV